MRITGCIATEKVAKVIVPSENMTIPLTDPFLVAPIHHVINGSGRLNSRWRAMNIIIPEQEPAVN